MTVRSVRGYQKDGGRSSQTKKDRSCKETDAVVWGISGAKMCQYNGKKGLRDCHLKNDQLELSEPKVTGTAPKAKAAVAVTEGKTDPKISGTEAKLELESSNRQRLDDWERILLGRKYG